MKKTKILLFVSYFIPGKKSGGPRQSILNLVDYLGDKFDFYIVTRDRDIGDNSQYDGIKTNAWVDKENFKVCYLSNTLSANKFLVDELKKEEYEFIYLNSFFDFLFSIRVVLICFFMGLDKKITLAPRGEFSPGALKIKVIKKKLFLYFYKFILNAKDVCFHSTSLEESIDIKYILGCSDDKLRFSANLPRQNYHIPGSGYDTIEKSSLSIVYLSRIVKKKNLIFCIDVLSDINVNVDFHIYGPIEDEVYWDECKLAIEKLPPNISCKYMGVVDPDLVNNVFSNYDLFFFPTFGENYGHVIVESLRVGTKVLLSDKTPWSMLDSMGIGKTLPLSSKGMFVDYINNYQQNKIILTKEERVEVKNKIESIIFSDELLLCAENLFK